MKNLNKLMPILIMILSCAGFAVTAKSQDLNLANLSAEDVKQIRKIIADRDYQTARADESDRQSNAWQKSAASWQSLYEAEKSRADGVQEKRITELRAEISELGKANAIYKLQAADDRQKLGEQELTIRKLKSARKYYFAAGFATGFASGGYAGYRIGARFRF